MVIEFWFIYPLLPQIYTSIVQIFAFDKSLECLNIDKKLRGKDTRKSGEFKALDYFSVFSLRAKF